LRTCVAGLPARGVWVAAAELRVLRSEFVFVHAATRIPGIDVPSSGSSAQAFVRMFARVVFCVASAAGRSFWIVAAVEGEVISCGGARGSGDPGVLFPVQRVVLL